MSRDNIALTRQQYDELMYDIVKNHRFAKGGRHIKYVRPNWDMRDGMCFSIKFDGLGCDKEGTEFHSGYGMNEPMYERIKAWLKSALKDTDTTESPSEAAAE